MNDKQAMVEKLKTIEIPLGMLSALHTEKKWWYNNGNQCLVQSEHCPRCEYIEIAADDVEYVNTFINDHKTEMDKFELYVSNGVYGVQFVRKPAKEPSKPTLDSVIASLEKVIQELKESK